MSKNTVACSLVSLNYRCGGSVGFFTPTSRLSFNLFREKEPNVRGRVVFKPNIVNIGGLSQQSDRCFEVLILPLRLLNL